MSGDSSGVFCSCGAAWFGRYRSAATAHIHNGCSQVTHGYYKKHFRCRCAECEEARKRERAKRQAKMPTVVELERSLSGDREALQAIVQRVIDGRRRKGSR
jgi:hypothetical protein